MQFFNVLIDTCVRAHGTAVDSTGKLKVNLCSPIGVIFQKTSLDKGLYDPCFSNFPAPVCIQVRRALFSSLFVDPA